MFNTEVDENVPEEAQVPAEAVASAGEEIPGEDVDEGVVNDSEGLPGELQDPEGAQFRVRPDPGEPTVSQIEDHRACGHWPYRSWCPECIKARGGCEQHRRRTEAKGISVFSFDYLFLDEAGNMIRREDVTENTAVALTILVAHDSKGKACFAHVVPQKGIDAEHYAVDALMRDVAWLGYTHISLRSDNEPAIVKLLQHALTEARYTVEDLEQILEEHPNTYDSSGNGQIEATVKQFTGILRTNKLDLEERLNKKIPLSSPLVTWLVEFAAFIITIRVKGDDGKTAHQRVRKCDFAKRLVPFGELVLVHLPIKSPERQNAGALDAHAKYGIILGYGRQRHSYQVFAEGAVKEYRTVHRLPCPSDGTRRGWKRSTSRRRTCTRAAARGRCHSRSGTKLPPTDSSRRGECRDSSSYGKPTSTLSWAALGGPNTAPNAAKPGVMGGRWRRTSSTRAVAARAWRACWHRPSVVADGWPTPK